MKNAENQCNYHYKCTVKVEFGVGWGLTTKIKILISSISANILYVSLV